MQPTLVHDAYRFLSDKLDQRFVAGMADGAVKPLWEIHVKHLQRIQSSHGVLVIGMDAIVFNADRVRESRTWWFLDIENISSSGPFQLTITLSNTPDHITEL